MRLAFSDEAFEVQKTSDGYIIVNIAGTANVIETETWNVTATVADFVAYDEENDSYICEDDGNLLSYKRLAPAQLIEKAKNLLAVTSCPEVIKRYNKFTQPRLLDEKQKRDCFAGSFFVWIKAVTICFKSFDFVSFCDFRLFFYTLFSDVRIRFAALNGAKAFGIIKQEVTAYEKRI